MPRLLTVSILLTVGALAPGEAAAQDSTAECLTEPTFRQAVLEALGSEAKRVPPGYRLRASSEETETGFRTTIRLLDPEGRVLGARSLEARECSTLLEEAGLAGALALTNLPARPGPPESPPLSAAVDPAPPPRSEERRPVSRSFLATLLLTSGGGPGLGGGLSGDLAFLYPGVALRLGFLLDLPSRGAVPGGALGIERFAVRASACLRARALSFCATAHEGAIRIRGLELVEARTVTQHFASIGPEIGLAIPLAPRLRLRASIGAQLPVWRIEVRDGGGPDLLWAMPPALVDAGLGLVLVLP